MLLLASDTIPMDLYNAFPTVSAYMFYVRAKAFLRSAVDFILFI